MCKLLVAFFHCIFFAVTNTNFACGGHGEWYAMQPESIKGPLLAGKERQEGLVNEGAGFQNLLCNENNDVFYINNLFPVTNHFFALDLAKILRKKGALTEEEFKKINDSWCIQNGSAGIDEYISSLEKFIDLVIAYLKIWEDKGTSVDVFIGLKEKIGTFKISKNIQELVRCIKEGARNENVRRLIHTERLLIFDAYYTYLDFGEGPFFGDTVSAPREPLVICSHFDMCASCESLMLNRSRDITGVGKFHSVPHPEVEYKILIGSFSPCRTSSRNIRSGDKNVLKTRIKLYKDVGSSPAGAKRSSSQGSVTNTSFPSATTFEPATQMPHTSSSVTAEDFQSTEDGSISTDKEGSSGASTVTEDNPFTSDPSRSSISSENYELLETFRKPHSFEEEGNDSTDEGRNSGEAPIIIDD